MELIGKRVGKVLIEERLGSGGMGEVFRGFDEVLERPVAVKVVSGHEGWSEQSRVRFRREARMLARFQHPNVCRVYDFVEEDEAAFLVLELLEGETLGAAMDRGLSREEVLAIAEQAARVLQAAHAKEIVHRDLKPDNIMLLPDGMVKVLDFGLARLVSDVEHLDQEVGGVGMSGPATKTTSMTTTTPGDVVGTLRYMSPEQALGDAVGPASDLYSLGLIVLECLTGEPAYPEASSRVERLLQVQDAGVRSIEIADPDLADLVRRLTDRRPEERPDADQVLRFFSQLREGAIRSRRRRAATIAAVAVAVLLLGAVALTYHLTRPRPWSGRGDLIRVALLPFVNSTGDAANDWVELGLLEMVTGGLNPCPGVSMVPAGSASKVANDLGVAGQTHLSAEQVSSLCQAFGADVVVAVDMRRSDAGYVLAYEAYGARGEVWRNQLPGGPLTELADRLSADLASRLAPGWNMAGVGQTFSADPFANLAYAMGTSTLDTAGPRSARAYFQVCLDRDPAFLRALLQLSRCEALEGELERASELAQQVRDAARSASDDELEGEALRQLADHSSLRGDFDQARQQLNEALAIAERAGDEANVRRVLNTIGRAEVRQSRFEEAEEHLATALELAVAAGDRGDEMYALVNLGLVSWQLGDTERARELFEQGLGISDLLRDRTTQLICLANLGALQLQAYQLDEAETTFNRIRVVAVEIGASEPEMAARSNLGIIHFYRREFARAREEWQRVLAFRKEAGDRPGAALVLNNLGDLANAEGRPDDALACWSESLLIRRELDDLRGQGRVLHNLATLALEGDDLEAAGRQYAEALDLLTRVGDRRSIARAAAGLGNVDLKAGRLPEARRWLNKAQEYSEELSEVLLLEARLSNAQRRFADALQAQLRAKDLMGEAWDSELEEELAVYRQAAETGVIAEFPSSQ